MPSAAVDPHTIEPRIKGYKIRRSEGGPASPAMIEAGIVLPRHGPASASSDGDALANSILAKRVAAVAADRTESLALALLCRASRRVPGRCEAGCRVEAAQADIAVLLCLSQPSVTSALRELIPAMLVTKTRNDGTLAEVTCAIEVMEPLAWPVR